MEWVIVYILVSLVDTNKKPQKYLSTHFFKVARKMLLQIQTAVGCSRMFTSCWNLQNVIFVRFVINWCTLAFFRQVFHILGLCSLLSRGPRTTVYRQRMICSSDSLSLNFRLRSIATKETPQEEFLTPMLQSHNCMFSSICLFLLFSSLRVTYLFPWTTLLKYICCFFKLYWFTALFKLLTVLFTVWIFFWDSGIYMHFIYHLWYFNITRLIGYPRGIWRVS